MEMEIGKIYPLYYGGGAQIEGFLKNLREARK